MYGYERPGTAARAVSRKREVPNPDKSSVETLGYEASIGGVMWSTLHATLIAGPEENWDASTYERGQMGIPRYYKTNGGSFFKICAHKIETLGATEMLDIWRNHWQKWGKEAEIFGTTVEYA